jgi:glycine hydroxymethyltransferase
MQGGPLMHVIAAKAVAFHEAMQRDFYDYQKAILNNATMLANELKGFGLRLVTGGTDNHLMLIDLTNKGITGRHLEDALASVGIVANHNAIPFDPLPTKQASGIRLGTPAVTTRGFGPEEMKSIARIVARVITAPHDERLLKEAGCEVSQMCARFPVPGLDR